MGVDDMDCVMSADEMNAMPGDGLNPRTHLG
jgi:hypothetical protein